MPKITAIEESGHEPRPPNCSEWFLKFGPIDILGQIFVCSGGAVLCTVGCLTASLSSGISPRLWQPEMSARVDRCAPTGKSPRVESQGSRACPGNEHSTLPSGGRCCRTTSVRVEGWLHPGPPPRVPLETEDSYCSLRGCLEEESQRWCCLHGILMEFTEAEKGNSLWSGRTPTQAQKWERQGR